MSYHLHHSPYGSRGCDHSSCLDYDDDYNSTPYQKPEPRPKPVPPSRWEIRRERWQQRERMTTVQKIMLVIYSPFYLLVLVGIAAVAGSVLVGLGWALWIFVQVVFGGAGGCSMQGGTC
jgi:hypothetical protein